MTDPIAIAAKRIRLTRQKRGYTLPKLAEKSGFSADLIGQLERGTKRNPTVRTIYAIAEALDVKPGYLLGWYD